MTPYAHVRISKEPGRWGHPPRKELLGQCGVVFGTQGPKLWVYVDALHSTYGVHMEDVVVIDESGSMDEYFPAFAQFYFDSFAYVMSFRRFFGSFENLYGFEDGFPTQFLLSYSKYAIANFDCLYAKCPFDGLLNRETMLERVTLYAASVTERFTQSGQPKPTPDA